MTDLKLIIGIVFVAIIVLRILKATVKTMITATVIGGIIYAVIRLIKG